MKLNLTSDEAQIIIDELYHSIMSRQVNQNQYAQKINAVREKILKTSRRKGGIDK